MRILIDIGHPAHVYLFKNLAQEMQKNGHSFYFTVREGENETELLEELEFNYIRIGKKRRTKIGKIFGLLIFPWKILVLALKFSPNLFLSHGSMYAGIAAFLLGKPHIAMEDTGNMEQIKFSKPVSSVILSPDVLPLYIGPKHIKYNGYHEIAYLHPDYYTPDKNIFKWLNINSNQLYAIVRFIAWGASHDMGHVGLSDNQKIKLVNMLSNYIKVFISSEGLLPRELEKYRMKIPFDKIHDAMYFARLYVGEGATMASESGILGVPSIYISTNQTYINNDQEKYGTVFNSFDYEKVKSKIIEILENDNSIYLFKMRSQKLLTEKINVTPFFIWFVENYPQSYSLLKNNPDHQYHFYKS